jgi:nitroreductase
MTGTTLPLGADELLTTTRSVRKRLDLDRPVPMDLVRECLEVALQAPTGGNAQGWHWIVVTDPGKRAAIGEHYARSFAAYRQSRLYPSAGDHEGEGAAVQQRVASSADHLADVVGRVPVHVIACIAAGSSEPHSPAWFPFGSSSPAAWSYQLAARARGLGTAWTTLHLRYEREIAELLGVPPHVHQGVLLPTAYYTGETFRPAPRAPLDEVLHVDGW